MPKKIVPHDEPIWDDLLTELTDPRPYEPAVAEFTKSYQPDDESFIDPEYFDHLLYEVAVEAEQAGDAFDGWRELADEAMDGIWTWPVRRYTWSDAPTAVMPHIGDINEITQEIQVVES